MHKDSRQRNLANAFQLCFLNFCIYRDLAVCGLELHRRVASRSLDRHLRLNATKCEEITTNGLGAPYDGWSRVQCLRSGGDWSEETGDKFLKRFYGITTKWDEPMTCRS